MVKNSRSRVAIWLSVILVILLAAGGAGYYLVSSFVGARESLDDAEVLTDVFPDESTRPAPSVTGSTTVLLLGSDTRGSIGQSLDSAGATGLT